MNYLKDNDNYTIIIPTYNRHKYLKRILNFYSQYDSKLKIIILDSSSENIDSELNSVMDQKNFDYHKYSPTISPWDKIANGCQFVNTPYVVLCADDDFIIPQAISKCTNFLEKNIDYSSAQGFTYKHHITETDNKLQFHFKRSNAKAKSIDDEKPLQRLSLYCKDHTIYNPVYAVHRTDLFSKIWKQTSIYGKNFMTGEIYSCAMSLLSGKMKVFDFFYSSREANQIRWYDDKLLKKMLSDKNLVTASIGLGKELCLSSKFPSDVLEKKIKSLINIYSLHALKKKNISIFSRLFLRGFDKLRIILTKNNNILNKELKKTNYFFEDDFIKVRETVLKYGN